MGNRPGSSFMKRQKERARQEKQREKLERKRQRRQESKNRAAEGGESFQIEEQVEEEDAPLTSESEPETDEPHS